MKLFWMTRRFLLILGVMMLGSVLAPRHAEAQAEPLLGQVSLFGFNFCPRNWAAADGQLLPIASHTALFSLFGTIYGGDGRTTFALPDLRGRSAIGQGTGPGLSTFRIGQRGGAETVTLTTPNLPSHNHPVNATKSIGDKGGPGGDFLAAGGDGHQAYHNGPPDRVMDPAMIGNTGGSQPFAIRDPFLAMQWCVALQGIFPSRS